MIAVDFTTSTLVTEALIFMLQYYLDNLPPEYYLRFLGVSIQYKHLWIIFILTSCIGFYVVFPAHQFMRLTDKLLTERRVKRILYC